MSWFGKLAMQGLEMLNGTDVKVTKGYAQIVGRSVTINSIAVTILAVDSVGDILLCTGLTKPTDASDGYAKGCLFIKKDASTGVKGVYENTGTKDSSVFDLMGAVAASEITLAEGSILVGNNAGVATALDAKTTTRILVGNGTTITSVAISADATMANTGALTIANNAVTRAKMSSAASSKLVQINPATIATAAGANSGYVIAPETGALMSVDFSGVDALAAHDTNYIEWTITNLGQAGAGSAVMLAATAANTTKVTGGTALAANTKRSLTLTGVSADLNVVKGDRLRVTATGNGTLANTVTYPVYCLCFSGTT